MRFLAYSHDLTLHNGLNFLTLAVLWVRAYEVVPPDQQVVIQTDWGAEFGGHSPHAIARLNADVFHPLGAQLTPYPLGRKGYNGRVERSHRSDDEEFYLPMLLQLHTLDEYPQGALQWVAYYSLHRPHYGTDMDRQTPMEKLRSFHLNPPPSLRPLAYPLA